MAAHLRPSLQGFGRVAFMVISVVVGAMLLAQLVVTYLAINAMRESSADATRENFGYVGEIVADHVLDQTTEIEQQVALLARDVQVGRMGDDPDADVLEMLSRIAPNDGTRAMLIAVPGETLTFARREGSGYVTRVYDLDAGTATSVTYSAGFVEVERGVSNLTSNVEERAWYVGAADLDRGEWVWSEPQLGSVTGDSNIWASAPAFVNGERVGVVAVGLRLAAISEALDNLPVGGGGGEAFVMTGTGLLVAVPSSRTTEFEQIVDETGAAVAAVDMGVNADARATDVVGQAVFGTDGEAITLERKLSDSRGLDWVLHVRANDAAVLPGFDRVEGALNLMAAVVALAIVMGAIGVLFLRHPIRRIRSRAMSDPLTGVANRHTLSESGRAILRNAARTQATVGVAVFDVDNFKQLNDNFGHDVGDAAILRIAETLVRETRDNDLVARLGGDEFVVVLTLPEDGRVESAVERLRSLVAIELAEFVSRVPNLGVTAGFARSKGDFYGTVDSLLHDADQALVAGKRRGKGSTYQFEPQAAGSR